MRMLKINISVLLMLQVCLLILIVNPTRADIYRYEDDDGIVHFTDAPTDRRFKIFMRELKKDKQLRTKLQLSSSVNPAEYDHIISTCATKYGVNPALIKAVIHAESGYNPNAVSRKGASGLMQLMPGTAKDLQVGDPFNPRENINGGSRYLRFLLDLFNNNLDLALAAYNAGPERVNQHRGIPPYLETRNYVQKVMQKYHSLKGDFSSSW